MKCLRAALEMLCLLFISKAGFGQDLDPRAYARVPVDATILISGFSYSDGGIVADVAVPLENGHATVETPSLGLGRTFSLFGQTAQAFGTVSYAWAQVTADVQGQGESTNRSGFTDMRFRVSMLFCGAPAATVQEFAKGSTSDHSWDKRDGCRAHWRCHNRWGSVGCSPPTPHSTQVRLSTLRTPCFHFRLT
jgi:hypothetical protein